MRTLRRVHAHPVLAFTSRCFWLKPRARVPQLRARTPDPWVEDLDDLLAPVRRLISLWRTEGANVGQRRTEEPPRPVPFRLPMHPSNFN